MSSWSSARALSTWRHYFHFQNLEMTSSTLWSRMVICCLCCWKVNYWCTVWDTESHSLHAVSNIGSRAFFVHYNRCISGDTRVHLTLLPGCIYYADLGYIREYFDDIKAWDEWPLYVDRLENYGMRNEQRPYHLEDVLATHCRRKDFNEYFLQIQGWSDEEIYDGDDDWRTDSFILGYPNLHVGHTLRLVLFSA